MRKMRHGEHAKAYKKICNDDDILQQWRSYNNGQRMVER